MTEEEVMKYLDKRKIPSPLHSKVFKLVGGRGIDLFNVSDDLLYKVSIYMF